MDSKIFNISFDNRLFDNSSKAHNSNKKKKESENNHRKEGNVIPLIFFSALAIRLTIM